MIVEHSDPRCHPLLLLLLLMHILYPTACLSGYYGIDCNTQCGKCAGNKTCDVNSGDCTGGCRGNWQVPKCDGKECRYF